jgi:hypothetical protein
MLPAALLTFGVHYRTKSRNAYSFCTNQLRGSRDQSRVPLNFVLSRYTGHVYDSVRNS